MKHGAVLATGPLLVAAALSGCASSGFQYEGMDAFGAYSGRVPSGITSCSVSTDGAKLHVQVWAHLGGHAYFDVTRSDGRAFLSDEPWTWPLTIKSVGLSKKERTWVIGPEACTTFQADAHFDRARNLHVHLRADCQALDRTHIFGELGWDSCEIERP